MSQGGGGFVPDSHGLETGLLEAIFPLGQKLSISGVSHGGGSDHAYNSMIAANMMAAGRGGPGH